MDAKGLGKENCRPPAQPVFHWKDIILDSRLCSNYVTQCLTLIYRKTYRKYLFICNAFKELNYIINKIKTIF